MSPLCHIASLPQGEEELLSTMGPCLHFGVHCLAPAHGTLVQMLLLIP